MKQAVILAAGEGQRLFPFTVERPKAMLRIAGKPIIQYVIESLAASCIRDLVIVAGYHKEQIFDYLGDGRNFGVEIRYVTQEEQRGTAHALSQAAGMTDKEFLALSGNRLISPCTLREIIAAGVPAVLSKIVAEPCRYGVIREENGLVAHIEEKPSFPSSNLINTGIYAFSEDIFKYAEKFADLPDAINSMTSDGIKITSLTTGEMWLDAVYPWDILNINGAILKNMKPSLSGIIEKGVVLRGNVYIGKDSVIRANTCISGPVRIGCGCEVGPQSCINPGTIMGDNAAVGPFAEIANSVIGNDVHIGSRASIHDSVIDCGCNIGTRVSAVSGEAEIKINGNVYRTHSGSFIGQRCDSGSAVFIHPGTILGNHSIVDSLKILLGTYPDNTKIS